MKNKQLFLKIHKERKILWSQIKKQKTGELINFSSPELNIYFIASQLAWILSATSFADFPLV